MGVHSKRSANIVLISSLVNSRLSGSSIIFFLLLVTIVTNFVFRIFFHVFLNRKDKSTVFKVRKSMSIRTKGNFLLRVCYGLVASRLLHLVSNSPHSRISPSPFTDISSRGLSAEDCSSKDKNVFLSLKRGISSNCSFLTITNFLALGSQHRYVIMSAPLFIVWKVPVATANSVNTVTIELENASFSVEFA